MIKVITSYSCFFEIGEYWYLEIYTYNENGGLINTFLTDESNTYLREEKVSINIKIKEIEYFDDQRFRFRIERLIHNDADVVLEKIQQKYLPVKGVKFKRWFRIILSMIGIITKFLS